MLMKKIIKHDNLLGDLASSSTLLIPRILFMFEQFALQTWIGKSQQEENWY